MLLEDYFCGSGFDGTKGCSFPQATWNVLLCWFDLLSQTRRLSRKRSDVIEEEKKRKKKRKKIKRRRIRRRSRRRGLGCFFFSSIRLSTEILLYNNNLNLLI